MIDHIIIKASRDPNIEKQMKQNYSKFIFRLAAITTGILAITIIIFGMFIETALAASTLIISVFLLWIVLMYMFHKLHIHGDIRIERKYIERYRSMDKDFQTIKNVDNSEFYELLNKFIIKHRDILSEYWIVNSDIGD